MKKPAALVFAATAVLLALTTGFAQAAPPGEPHLPDLQTLKPADLRIENAGGVKELFFSNTVGNYGDGPLELKAVNDPETRKTRAYQEIWTHDEAGHTQVLSSTLVGTFEFHPEHNHWHFGDYARYDIRAVALDGTPGSILRSAQKVSFCIIDSLTVDATLEHYDWGANHGCSATSRQGLRVGRGDVYYSFLPDQFVDVTGLADGDYYLVCTVDPPTFRRPGGRLTESNDTNNTYALKIQIRGNTVHSL